MNSLQLAQLLTQKYKTETHKPKNISRNQNYLTPNIRPTETYIYQSTRATLHSNKGSILDISSMTVNTILGQNDPWVKANLIAYLQSDRPSFLSTRFGSEYYYKTARLIAKHSFIDNPVVNHRQCNGSDATELAILAAYNASSKPHKTLISFYGSYHGQNLTSYFVSDLQRHNIFLVNNTQANIKFFHPPTNEIAENQILENIHHLRKFTFGIILEPIQVNNNIYTFSQRFLQKLKALCDQEDIALIFDEIQTAYGWLGKMTASEYFNVKPNITALSKGITSGFGPLAAIVANKKYQEIPYGTGEKTNGADIRSLVASTAVYQRLLGIPESQIPHNLPDYLHQELSTGLLAKVPQKSRIITHYTNKIQKTFSPKDLKITGLLLLCGLTFTDKSKAQKAYQLLMDQNIYIRLSANTLIIKPALTINDQELSYALEKIFITLKQILPHSQAPNIPKPATQQLKPHYSHLSTLF
ncbi:hypothetical protein CVV38_00555 [Candidatus Peregrinibacteria bacterium HGW-Peregrinibacteria-1]|jgi:acetylornithine/succinyldiaminopimelate/putrescine aminotransferase|nr:MAG: hypothetical protein CVV38_00555 [Candidatus Peregrinibacteria bacterium HGW-Peregrinibacteria-1]